MVSNTQRYYQGGCRPLVTSGGTSTAANSSTSTNHPTKDEGCAKQGECHITFLEQQRRWTATGSLLAVDTPAASVMTTLLTGAVESYAGACRSLYPLPAPEGDMTNQVAMRVTASGNEADFTPAVVTGLQNTIAAKLSVSPSQVAITVAPGSVVLTVVTSYTSAADATAGASTMTAAMGTPAAASTFLSSPSFTVTVASIDNAPTATVFSAGSNPFPVAVGGSSGLSTGAIAGIAVGASVAVLALVAVCFMQKGKGPATKTTA
jgi:hypothetical protein